MKNWVIACCLGCSLYAQAANVRVRSGRGGPQILLDGEPIAPRVFYGSRRGGFEPTSPQWTRCAFEFAPAEAVPNRGTLHFRFDKRPAEYWIKDLRLFDAATGKDVLRPGSFADAAAFKDVWNVWPPGARNTVGRVEIRDAALHVVVKAPPGGRWPDFHLYSDIALAFEAGRTYRCEFLVRSRPASRVMPAVYHVDHHVWRRIGGPPGVFLQQVALARDAGVRFISTGAPTCWTPPDQPENWEPMDRVCREVIRAHPRALLLLRVGCNAPGWWLDQHPEALMRYEGGKPGRYASVSSREYRADAAAHLEKLCRHLTKTFPKHFAGIHPAGQNTGEWFYDRSWRRPLSGYDACTLKAWRAWMARRGEPGAAQAQVPSPAERHAGPNGCLRDPASERRLILFNRFWQEEMADFVCALAAAARRGTQGKKLVIFFYGYVFEFGPMSNGPALSGHYALTKALASPDIDVLCSPISYFDRQWKGTAPCMSAAESVMAAGKLWLNEDDTRTYLARTRRYGGLADLAQTRAVMLRNTAQAALRGFGTWWMDLPGLGWFADKRIWDVLVRLRPVDEAMLRRAAPFTPDIAAIVGEESLISLAGGAQVVGRPLIYESRAALGRCGAPYGQYLLRDAVAGRVPAKLQIYLAAWSLSPAQRRQLAANRRPGVVRVWCYAPGYLLPDRADVRAMTEVTGFAHERVDLPQATAAPTAAGRRFGPTRTWGPKGRTRPLFAVRPRAGDVVLATYRDGSAAAALRRSPAGVDVFIGVPQLTPELVRALARLAGVHLYTRVDASVWAAGPFLSVHAMSDGPLLIDTGADAPVCDALDGAKLGRGPRLSLPIRAGQTRVLRIR